MSIPAKKLVARAVATSLTAFLIQQSASAAAPQAEATELPEVLVTAQFIEQNLQDTPIAITAVNAEMLEQRGQTNIAQVAAQAPNVSLRPQPQNGGSGLIAFIRGVGQVDFNYALDPGVGIYVDDVYIPTLSSSLLELIDLDRIEILRGPQGTLAGKNAIGGAIKLFSAKPQGDGSGSLRVSYGALNMLNLRGVADLALTDDLSLRVSGMSRSRDGYVGMLDYGQTHPTSNVPQTNTRGNGNSDYSTMGGQNVLASRTALRFKPNDKLEFNVSADFTREKSEAIPTVLIAAGAVVADPEDFDPDSTRPANTGGTPWLRGKDGNAVNLSCIFVAAGPYGCDPGGSRLGWDRRFISYSNFLDGMDPVTIAPYKAYAALPITEFRGSGFHGTATYDFNDNLQLVYIGSYRKYTSKFGQDQDATPIPISQLDNELHHNAFTSEVRLNAKFADGLVDATVGLFYLDQKGTYTARVDLNYVDPVIDFLHGPDTTPSKTQAVFGTATWHPMEAMSFTGGLRFTKDKKDYTYFRSNPDGTIPNPAVCFSGPPASFYLEPNCLLAGLYDITGRFGGKDGERLDWRVVGDYRFTPDLLAYASASTGFKGGGVNPRPFTADQRLPFKPETLTTYEVGFKSDLLDSRMRLNGAAFLNKYEDIVLRKLVCPESVLQSPCLRPANIGSADVKGLELEASIYPVRGLSFEGSISYLDFKYTSAVDANGFLVNTAIPKGGITPYTPELSYSLGAQYDHETSFGKFSYRVDGSYQSKVYDNAENTSWATISGRFITNGRISWSRQADWKVSLEVQNLLDKYYFESVSDNTTSLGMVSGVPALPRTWAMTVERTF